MLKVGLSKFKLCLTYSVGCSGAGSVVLSVDSGALSSALSSETASSSETVDVALGSVATGVVTAVASGASSSMLLTILFSELSSLFDFPPIFACERFARYRPNERTKNPMMAKTVVLVSTFAAFPPNACSAAPPPNAAPIPAFALGFCIKITRTTNALSRSNSAVKITIKIDMIKLLKVVRETGNAVAVNSNYISKSFSMQVKGF